MTELDAELGPLAVEVIDEYGKAVEYWLVEGTGYNTGTGQAGGAETPVPGVKVAPPEDYAARTVAGSAGLIERGDKKLTTAALYFPEAPTNGDKCRFDGTTYYVQDVQTVYSGELPCLYILQVRG